MPSETVISLSLRINTDSCFRSLGFPVPLSWGELWSGVRCPKQEWRAGQASEFSSPAALSHSLAAMGNLSLALKMDALVLRTHLNGRGRDTGLEAVGSQTCLVAVNNNHNRKREHQRKGFWLPRPNTAHLSLHTDTCKLFSLCYNMATQNLTHTHTATPLRHT